MTQSVTGRPSGGERGVRGGWWVGPFGSVVPRMPSVKWATGGGGHRECPSPVRACVVAGRGRLGVCRRSPGRRAGQPGWEGRDAPEKAAEAGGTLTTSQLSDDFLSVPLLPSE